jgi:hypothetical protein
MATKKILALIPTNLKKEYDLNKPHLKDLTVSDLNNITQAVMEHTRKGGKITGQSCCTTMCCI